MRNTPYTLQPDATTACASTCRCNESAASSTAGSARLVRASNSGPSTSAARRMAAKAKRTTCAARRCRHASSRQGGCTSILSSNRHVAPDRHHTPSEPRLSHLAGSRSTSHLPGGACPGGTIPPRAMALPARAAPKARPHPCAPLRLMLGRPCSSRRRRLHKSRGPPATPPSCRLAPRSPRRRHRRMLPPPPSRMRCRMYRGTSPPGQAPQGAAMSLRSASALPPGARARPPPPWPPAT